MEPRTCIMRTVASSNYSLKSFTAIFGSLGCVQRERSNTFASSIGTIAPKCANRKPKCSEKIRSLLSKVEQSRRTVEKRCKGLPKVSFPANLPVSNRVDDIVQMIQNHQVLVLAGETGSGKSTQIPKMCLSAGRGLKGKVGCTQPRRVAAQSLARRVAEELRYPLVER
jgi:HrpA-like RNA helicase